jgi:hypothetical protein
MQMLKLADDLMPLAREGYKRVTVRTGRRAITTGPMKFEATHGTEADVAVNVTQVAVMSLKDVPAWALAGENLATAEELHEVLLPYYPTVTMDSEITCIEFKVAAASIAA